MLHGCMMDACSGIESTDAHDDMIYFQRATDRAVFECSLMHWLGDDTGSLLHIWDSSLISMAMHYTSKQASKQASKLASKQASKHATSKQCQADPKVLKLLTSLCCFSLSFSLSLCCFSLLFLCCFSLCCLSLSLSSLYIISLSLRDTLQGPMVYFPNSPL